VVPYVAGLASAYGGAVLDKVRDEAADAGAEASIGLARRLLRRLLGRQGSRPEVEAAVRDVAAHPGDEDFEVALKAQLRKVLESDLDLAKDLSSLLQKAGVGVHVTALGERSIAAHTVSGVAATGDNVRVTRD
jgi:hypothetical protein